MERIKVFLVEDEVVVRKGIEKSIRWEENGYEFVGEASDGEVALPLILKTKPDILITDVKMPFMNGLELSRIVKQELPSTKIIILSGYNEFDYAKEAINLSVTEYLLKPISAAQLLKSLDGVKDIIMQERSEKELLKKYSEEMEGNIDVAKSRFFRQLLFGDMSTGEAIETGKKYNVSLSAGMYVIVIFKIMPSAEPDEVSTGVFEVENTIDEVVGSIDNMLTIQKGMEGWTFLIMADDDADMDERLETLKGILKDMMNRLGNPEYFGGIGRRVKRIRELRQSYSDADKAFIGRFSLKSNQIISLDELNKYEKESMEIAGFANVEHSRELIEKYLRNGTEAELDGFVDLYMEEFTKDALTSEIMRQYLIMDIFVTVMSFCEKMDIADGDFKAEAENIRNTMQRQESMGHLSASLKKLLSMAVSARDGSSAKRYVDVITRAQSIIGEQYMQEDISLNTVADMVGMSPSYFSSVFSREVGKTFVEYLTEIRMDKAKELLICSAMKTSDIGHKVGYKDSHYFSYIFKKKQGCSPKEYRARKKGN
ncbi:MAG: response regulator [Lachnospiraceae bacterium]|nr:response regulator [Lachnospiraceae bacterium]